MEHGVICDDLGGNILYFAGPLLTLNVQISASDCVDIVGNQMHPMVQILFPNNDAIFQNDDSPIHTGRSVQSWFEEHADALQQSSVASTIAQLKYHRITVVSFIDSKVRSNWKMSGTVFH